MVLIASILLVLCHLLSGYGLLHLFAIRQKMAITLPLSLILGVAIASFVPFVLQLCYIVLTGASVFLSLGIACLLLNIPGLLQIRKKGGFSSRSFRVYWSRSLRSGWSRLRSLHIRLYEVPYWLILGFLVFVSVWRCYYLPPTSRDALSGPEAIAEYAVREHTMINSFFTVDLWTTNNQFKSPYLISLQMIYKMAGFPFGQWWLSLVFVSFTVLLYQILKERLHPVVAGLLLLLFMMTPELYAYTFMILYDYSNMVFFFLSLFFLFDYLKSKVSRTLYFAGLLMGIATYIRSETLVFAFFFIPVVWLMQFREKYPYRTLLLSGGLFILPSLAGYYLTIELYIKYYLPLHYNIGDLVNPHLSDIGSLFKRYGDICTRLLTGNLAMHLWGYFMGVWAVLFLFELIFFRRLSRQSRNWLYAIVLVYIILGLLGYLLPLFELTDATKRAMFKILPLMLLYLANHQGLLRLSAWISRWENAAPATAAVLPGKAGKVAATPLQQDAGKPARETGKGAVRRLPGKNKPGL